MGRGFEPRWAYCYPNSFLAVRPSLHRAPGRGQLAPVGSGLYPVFDPLTAQPRASRHSHTAVLYDRIMAQTTTGAEPLLEAAATLVAESGMGSVTFRQVAVAAGTSPSRVQYYFRTKSQLIGSVFDRINHQFLVDLGSALTEPPSLDRLRRIVWRWLPLDAQRERRARIWAAFAAFAVTDDELAAAAARFDQQLRDWLATDLDALRTAGQVRPEMSSAVAAGQLLSLVDGTTLHCLVVPMDRRPSLVEQNLATWFDGLAQPTEGTGGL